MKLPDKTMAAVGANTVDFLVFAAHAALVVLVVG
jgi:hypothetical protein